MKKLHIYMIGIGGISMSALAVFLKQDGYCVSGYDAQKNNITKDLQSQKIKVYQEPKLESLQNVFLVVVSAAIPHEHPDILEAQKRHIPILNRGQLLGWIARQYRNVIAVAGSHGKTTTTAMITAIFQAADCKPTVHIGGILVEQGKNYICGGKDYFITEACEYKDNFLYLYPTFSVLLNVEPDHLDYFKTFKREKKSFQKWTLQSKAGIAPAPYATHDLILGRDYRATNICETDTGLHFTCLKRDQKFLQIFLPCYGKYQVHNALAAIAAADYFHIKPEKIAAGLAAFCGVKCRMELHPFYHNSRLIFDYAHHPTEIHSSIQTVRQHCNGKMIVLFQPHTYSRTKRLFQEFLNAFDGVDELMVYQTYPAREQYDEKGDAKTLFKALQKNGINCSYERKPDCLQKLESRMQSEDVVLVLGAGDFYTKCIF